MRSQEIKMLPPISTSAFYIMEKGESVKQSKMFYESILRTPFRYGSMKLDSDYGD